MTGVVEIEIEQDTDLCDQNVRAKMQEKKLDQLNNEAAVGVPPAPDGAPTKPLTNGDVPHTPASSPPPLVNGETAPSGGDEGKPAETDDESNDEKDVKKDEKDGKKDEKDGKKDEKDDEKDSMMQDLGFIIKIVAPNMEPFDLPVSSMELVQEIFQVLIDKEETCERTCFSLQLDGVTMDNFAELKTIEGLKENSVVRVVKEPYTVREARIHVRHVRDLLKSVDSQDAYNGIDCNSLSFLNIITNGDILDKKMSKPESVECTPPDYIMPGSKERPLLPLHPAEVKMQPCLKVLTYSGWNPPPGNRKMHGDLLYLYIVTMEERRYHVTASTRGFYINQSTQDEFNPRPAAQKHMCHSLIDVLSQISPIFKRNFQILLKRRADKHPFERVATPYQLYSWMVPAMDHSIDSIRAEDAFSSRLGYEEHIPGQTRDWNEELQTTRELPQKNLPERLIRERAIFKVHSDFVVAATRGAMSVIDGNIMAINPGEDSKMQMFLWNNIFFSLGFDVKDHYQDFGGDAAAYAAPGSDLRGVRAYASVDVDGLYTLGTVVVDYRGYRVTAQSIIPGILEREQEQSVVYGSVDFGKTVVTSDKYKELLNKTLHALKIHPHSVINEKDEEISVFSSVECKGIIGNDGRHYILDLLRTFPPDMNYLPTVGEGLSEEMTALGYPKPHRHQLVCLRQELIDAFVENRYVAFVRHAALHFQQWRLKKLEATKQSRLKEIEEKKTDESSEGVSTDKVVSSGAVSENCTDSKRSKCESERTKECSDVAVPTAGETLAKDEAKKIVDAFTKDNGNFEENSKEIMRKAAEAVGSLSDAEFNISFNSDVMQPHVRHANPQSAMFKKEKQLVKNVAEFLVLHQIPSFIRDCIENTSAPIDGGTLTEALHHCGVNMRYLGTVTQMVAKQPTLSYIHTICVSELVCRASKHLFKVYIQGVEMMNLSMAVSHFLNCLLGSYPTPHSQCMADELQSQRSRKRNRKKNKGALTSGADNNEWAAELPKTLWKKIVDEIQEYYDYKLECDGIDVLVEQFGVQKVSLLRATARAFGLQFLLREYGLDSRTKQPFYEDDIINLVPIVKNIHPKASDAYHVFTSGQSKIQQGFLCEGFDLISEALNLLNNVYGAMHPEIAACARLLARLNYIMGDYPEALVYQQRAVLMSERVQGVDHPNTITEYAHLALYCFANNQVSTSLKLMYRVRYLALLCFGENHPEVALFDSNIGLILHAVGEFDLSLRFLQKALELNSKFIGAKSVKVAMNYHLVARTYSCKGDFRTALHNEKQAYIIYKQLLGEQHERTRESTECLKHLTQQAVKFQKTMNQISKGEHVSSMPPLQIHTPSLANVLDTLNVLNGIVFVHISQDDIEKFRDEMVQRQQQQQQQQSSESAAEPAIESAAQPAVEPAAAASSKTASEDSSDDSGRASDNDPDTPPTPAGSDPGTASVPTESDPGTTPTPAGSDPGTVTPAESDPGTATTLAESEPGTAPTPAESEPGTAPTPAESEPGTATTPAESDTGSSTTVENQST